MNIKQLHCADTHTTCEGRIETRTLYWPTTLCDAHYESRKSAQKALLEQSLAEYRACPCNCGGIVRKDA